jgi:hypothetical protein
MAYENLKKTLPTVQSVLDLAPEDLAGILLCELAVSNPGQISEYGLIANVQEIYKSDAVPQAFIEALQWLANTGLVGNSVRTRDHLSLTRLGRRIAKENSFQTFQRERVLPYDLLHPKIASKVWTIYLRGDFDIAVAQAFKEVEVTMRDRGSFSTSDYSVGLIRKFLKDFGFGTSPGPKLATETAEEHLFIGALKLYRHRAVHAANAISDSQTGAEVLILASHLLTLVERAVRRT